MGKKLFIIGDIHGEYDLLEKLMKLVDFNEHQLVFLGDLIDRGPKVKDVILTVKSLVEQHGAICIKGNHEDILAQWLDNPEEKMDWYLRNGGQATIESLLYHGVFDDETPTKMAELVRHRHPELVQFLIDLPLFYETNEVICVHAGVNLMLDDWHETSMRDILWIREPFHHAYNNTGKYIVFGHTPVQGLHNDLFRTDVWCHQNKIGMDGGAVYQGSLHGLVLNKGAIEADYQIYHPLHRFEKFETIDMNESAE